MTDDVRPSGPAADAATGSWRVAWRSKHTGATGHGTGVFTYADATRYATELNESASGEWCVHSAERVPPVAPKAPPEGRNE